MRTVYFRRKRNTVVYVLLLIFVILMVRAGELTWWAVVIFVAVLVWALVIEFRTKKLGFDEHNIYLEGWGSKETVLFENVIKIRLSRPGFVQRTLFNTFKISYKDEYGNNKSWLFHIPHDQSHNWSRLKEKIATGNPLVVIDEGGPWFY